MKNRNKNNFWFFSQYWNGIWWLFLFSDLNLKNETQFAYIVPTLIGFQRKNTLFTRRFIEFHVKKWLFSIQFRPRRETKSDSKRKQLHINKKRTENFQLLCHTDHIDNLKWKIISDFFPAANRKQSWNWFRIALVLALDDNDLIEDGKSWIPSNVGMLCAGSYCRSSTTQTPFGIYYTLKTRSYCPIRMLYISNNHNIMI